MAFGYATHNASESSSLSISRPTVSDGDILVAFIGCWGWSTPGDIALPAGWAVWEKQSLDPSNALGKCTVGWKRASSEGASYSFSSSGAAEMYGIVFTVTGREASGDPLDVASNTRYTTNDTTVRAAGMTIQTAGSDLFWCGIAAPGASPTMTPPSGMTSCDSYDVSASEISLDVAMLANQDTGATGNKNGSIPSSKQYKHAFMVALKSAAAPSGLSIPVVMHHYRTLRR